MAKLRSNHAGRGGAQSGTVIRVGIFAAIIGGLVYLFNFFNGTEGPNTLIDDTIVTVADTADDRSFYLPSSTTGTIVHHPYFSLSYDEEHEQAEWVAYILTRERLNMPWFERADRFEEDLKVPSGSATWQDYRGSGYDRGHLAPAADMAFSKASMEQSFLMSNISPQSHDFNKGIWKELEELTRSWAKKYKKLYVVTGPILTEDIKGSIGENEVSIPIGFYKVLLDISEPENKGIAFVLPNEISYEPLYKYATSIDAVEELTGIDFFSNLMTRDTEKELEADFNIDLWEFSKQKFDLRVNKWNKE
ncbi:MAG: DNA/RNA non-specific endonuclease [Saprospiraceae bacterium]